MSDTLIIVLLVINLLMNAKLFMLNRKLWGEIRGDSDE